MKLCVICSILLAPMFLFKSSVPEYGDYKLREATMNVNASGSSFGDNATGGLQP